MEKYIITEFNRRRLQRGEQYCYRADVYIDNVYQTWVWLCKKDINKILKDKDCILIKEYEDDTK